MSKQILLVIFLVVQGFIGSAQYSQEAYVASNNPEAGINFDLKAEDYLQPRFSVEKFNEKFDQTAVMHPLERVGKILTFIGIPLAVIGGILVSQADALHYTCINGECEGDPKGALGVVMLGGGVGMGATGLVLWSIGKKK